MLIVLLSVLAVAYCNSHNINAPCVFRADEIEMHQYAAVLAATEPFRIQCDEQIRKALNPLNYFSYWYKGKSLKHIIPIRSKNKAVDDACSRYEHRVENTLRSYGMNVQSFNNISRTLSVNTRAPLKKKITLQAYYYKIAADLEKNLSPSMPFLPSIEKRPILRIPFSPNAKEKFSELQDNINDNIPQITRFSRAIWSLEQERNNYRNYLKTNLNLSTLPVNMNDPEMQPAMCPEIRKACAEFRQTAQHIIVQNGLLVDEYNNLYQKMNKNPFYRYFVKREIGAIEKQWHK